MFLINFNKNNISKLSLFLLISWFILWVSINTYPPKFLIFNEKINYFINGEIKIFDLINDIRFLTPFIFTNIILIFLNIKKFQHIKFKNSVLYIFFFITLLHLISLLILDYNKFTIERIFLPILAINGLMILNLVNDKIILEYFFKLSLIALLIALIIYLPQYYITWIFIEKNYYFYHSQLFDLNFFEDPMIRSTGVARIFLILFIFSIINFNIKKNILSFLVTLFCLINIWGFQSRTIIGITLIILTLNFIFLYESTLKNKVLFFLIFICATPLAYNSAYELKMQVQKRIKLKSIENYKLYLETNKIPLQTNENFTPNKKTRLNVNKNFFSGRFEIWQKAIDIYQFKFFGFGPQADRFEVLTKKNFQNDQFSSYKTNVSNAYLYTLICGGIISLILILYLNLIIAYKILRNIKFINKKNKYFKISSLVLFTLLLRGLTENSYAVFSIDYMLLILSAHYLLKKANP